MYIWVQMTIQRKINLLRVACIVILGALILIQYDLVIKTYRLTEAQYRREVKSSAISILSKEVPVERRITNNFTSLLESKRLRKVPLNTLLKIVAEQSDSILRECKQDYDSSFKQSDTLRNIGYLLHLERLILAIDGTQFPLSTKANLGDPLKSVTTKNDDPWEVRSFNNSLVGNNISLGIQKDTLVNVRLIVQGRQYIDVSDGRSMIISRMGTTFAMTATLLIAVCVLFYLMFSAIIRQKKLAEIQKDFADNITHELQTPLSSVQIILKRLEKEETIIHSAPALELLKSLKRQFYRIKQTMDSVLESAMLNSTDPILRSIDMAEHLREYANDLKFGDHLLEVGITTGPRLLNTNPQLLDKALNNLIDNALKYSPAKSVVSIHAYEKSDNYVIEIRDQGPGIELRYQQLIFDKFFRVPQQNKHNTKGLGLGLYTSKKAIKQLGGSLSYSSAEHGSIFTIKLPINEG